MEGAGLHKGASKGCNSQAIDYEHDERAAVGDQLHADLLPVLGPSRDYKTKLKDTRLESQSTVQEEVERDMGPIT